MQSVFHLSIQVKYDSIVQYYIQNIILNRYAVLKGFNNANLYFYDGIIYGLNINLLFSDHFPLNKAFL